MPRIKHVRLLTHPVVNTKYYTKIIDRSNGKVIDLVEKVPTLVSLPTDIGKKIDNYTLRRVMNVMDDDLRNQTEFDWINVSGLKFGAVEFSGSDTATSVPFFETKEWNTSRTQSIEFTIEFGAARLANSARTGNAVYNNFINGSYKIRGWIYGAPTSGKQTIKLEPHQSRTDVMWATVSGTTNDRNLQLYNKSRQLVPISTLRVNLYSGYEYTDIRVQRTNGGKGLSLSLATYCALSKSGEQAWTCWTSYIDYRLNKIKYWDL